MENDNNKSNNKSETSKTTKINPQPVQAQTKKGKKFLKTIIYLVLAALFLVLTYFSMENRKKAAYTIAYLNVPQEVSTQINSLLERQFIGKIDTVYLEPDFVPSKKALKKIDAVFTWNGKWAQELLPYAKEYQPFLLDSMTKSVASNATVNSKLIALPILYDCQLLATLKNTEDIYYLSIPEDFQDFQQQLINTSGMVTYPLCVAGAQDQELLSFISTVFQATAGTESYIQLIDAVQAAQDYNDIYHIQFGNTSLEQTVELINSWKTQGLLNSGWKNLTTQNINDLMASGSVYAIPTNLLHLQSLESRTSSRYNAQVFPQLPFEQNQNVIGTQLVMLNTGDKKITETVARYLTLTQIQEELTTGTRLVPSDQYAQIPYTLLDDIRFYTTFSPSGVLPDLYNGCFTSPQKAAEFSSWIRSKLQ